MDREGCFETDENGILTGRYFGRCNVKRLSERIYAKRQERNTMQGDRDIAGQLIMTVESNNEALIELSKIYDIVWRQCPCLKA